MKSRKGPSSKTRSFLAVDPAAGPDILPRPTFVNLLRLERSRAERAKRRVVLMLVECPSLLNPGEPTGAAGKIQNALARSSRDTDIIGWYRDGAVLGVIFTEFPLAETSVSEMLSGKVNTALRDALGAERAGRVALTVHVFPDDSTDLV